MLPAAIKRATELHLFIHPVSSLVETTVTVSFDSITWGDLKCLEKESSWFCWFLESLLIRLRLGHVSSQYSIASCRCVILLCDCYIYLLTTKMNQMWTYSTLVVCFFEPNCQGPIRLEEFGCCSPGSIYHSQYDPAGPVPCHNWWGYSQYTCRVCWTQRITISLWNL